MNIDIQLAVIALFGHCMEITEAGRYEAHMQYAGNTSGVYVRIYEAGGQTQVFSEHIYLDGLKLSTPKEVIANINALTDRVCEFLREEQGVAA